MPATKGHHPETIAAAKLGREIGAAVIILTWLEESQEIIEFGDYIIHYSFDASPDHLAGDIGYAGEKTMCALQVAVELLKSDRGRTATTISSSRVPGMICHRDPQGPRSCCSARSGLCRGYRTTPSSTPWAARAAGAAYMEESIYIFMEMQWIHSGTIHTGEFFRSL